MDDWNEGDSLGREGKGERKEVVGDGWVNVKGLLKWCCGF